MGQTVKKKQKKHNISKNAAPAPEEKPLKKSERNSSFELLRIFAMLIIILHHFVYHGGGLNIGFDVGINRYAAQVLLVGNCLGINLFFMLSGYFLVSGKFNIKRIIRLDLSAIFYAAATVLATMLIWKNPAGHQAMTWVRAFLPITYYQYWFITIYVVLYLLSPFFNKLINQLDKKQFTVMAAIMFIMASVIPAIRTDTSFTVFSNQFLTGLFGYFVGAYLRKYPIKFMDNKWLPTLMFIGSYALICAVSAIGAKHEFLNDASPLIIIKGSVIGNSWSLLNAIAAVSLMMLCKNIKLGSVKSVNFISQCCVGVYLIHDSNALRPYLWSSIVKTPVMAQTALYPIKAIVSAIMIFAACSVIDLVRIYILEKPIMKIKRFDKFFAKIDNFMNNI